MRDPTAAGPPSTVNRSGGARTASRGYVGRRRGCAFPETPAECPPDRSSVQERDPTIARRLPSTRGTAQASAVGQGTGDVTGPLCTSAYRPAVRGKRLRVLG
ncbi:hypothetical protein MRX96_049937 [Rhipicephalus microplus]